MSAEVETLLKSCGLERHYPKFMKSGYRSINELNRRQVAVQALLPNSKDYAVFTAALKSWNEKEGGGISGKSGTASTARPASAPFGNATETGFTTSTPRAPPEDPDDLVLAELQAWHAKLREELRESASTCAFDMVESASAFKRTPKPLRPAAQKMLVAKEQETVEHNKTMLAVCNSGLKAHRQYVEISKLRQMRKNRGGDPIENSKLDKELEELSRYVQDVLVTLAEEKKGLRKPVFASDLAEAREKQAAADSAAIQALRNLLKEKEDKLEALDREINDEFRSMQAESVRFADEKEGLERKITLLEAEVSAWKVKQADSNAAQSRTAFSFSSKSTEAGYLASAGNLQQEALFSRCELLYSTLVEVTKTHCSVEDELRRRLVDKQAQVAELELKLAEAERTRQLEAELHAVALTNLSIEHDARVHQLQEAYEAAVSRHLADKTSWDSVRSSTEMETSKILAELNRQVEQTMEEVQRKEKEIAFLKKESALVTNNWRTEQSLRVSLEGIVNREKLPIAVQTLTPRTLRSELAALAPPTKTAAPWLALATDETVGIADLPAVYQELVACLLSKHFDNGYAVRHAHRLYHVATGAMKYAEAAKPTSSDRTAAIACAESIENQVAIILDRWHSAKGLPEPVQRPNSELAPSANEVEGDGAGTTMTHSIGVDATVPSGIPLLDLEFLSSWRLLENVVGHRMPRNAEEEKQAGDMPAAPNLEEELMATFYETMRVARALRAELYCATPLKKQQTEDDDFVIHQVRDPEAKSPIEIKGRRRQ